MYRFSNIDREEIEHYFLDILRKHRFIIEKITDYELIMSNQACKIEFIITGHYYLEFEIYVVDLRNNLKYSVFDILDNLGYGIGKEILTDDEVLEAKKIKDELSNQLYSFGIIFNKFFGKLFNGDFSIMESPS